MDLDDQGRVASAAVEFQPCCWLTNCTLRCALRRAGRVSEAAMNASLGITFRDVRRVRRRRLCRWRALSPVHGRPLLRPTPQ